MPTKRSDEPESVDRRRFLGASVSTAALPFVGAGLDQAFAEPVALTPSDSPVLVALSVNGDAHRLGLDVLRPCLTPCGSISDSRDQRRAVTTASAGPARCILTGCGSFLALRSP
jgi:hypothetical protein